MANLTHLSNILLLRFLCKAEHFKSLYYFHDKSVVASLQFEFVDLLIALVMG